jgi:hypothetical protein
MGGDTKERKETKFFLNAVGLFVSVVTEYTLDK